MPLTPKLAPLAPLLRLGLRLALLLALCLPVAACGLAESIGENFVDDENVVLPHRLDRSGTILRMADGTEIEALPAQLYVGDAVLDAYGTCVFGFAIDPSLQPGNSEINQATLRIWVEPDQGAPDTLGPLIVSHLPGHPDRLLATGMVPNPPGNDLGSLPGPFAAGWREIDVTAAFLQDWNAGGSITAFAVRLTTPTNGDVQADTLTFDGTDGDGQALTTQLVVRFSLSL